MDAIYFEKPILLIIPIVLLAWQIASHFASVKLQSSKNAVLLIGGFNAALHAVGITILMLMGGTMNDVLVMVLLTGFTAILLCPKPAEETEGKNK